MNDFLLALRLTARAGGFRVIGYFVVFGLLASFFAARFSARSPETMAMDIGLSIVKIEAVFLIILMSQELFSKEFERRYFNISFTYPRDRFVLMLGRLGAILMTVVIMLLVFSLLHTLVVKASAMGYAQSTPVTTGGKYYLAMTFVFIDLIAVTAFSVMVAVCPITPTFLPVSVVGFVLIARSYMAIVELLLDNKNLVSKLVEPQDYTNAISMLRYVFPDLGSLDIRKIALYNNIDFLPQEWSLIVGASICWSALMLCIAAIVLNRRALD